MSSWVLEINKVKKCKVTKKQIEDMTQKADVVVANIIDGILLHLKDHLWRLTQQNGYLILSGILVENAERFLAEFCYGQRYKVISTLSDKEWTSYLIQKL